MKLQFSSFQEVLVKINEFGFGYVLIENQNKEFVGIISMADIRKGLISNDFDIDNIKVKDIINHNPVSVESDRDIN